LPFSLYLFFLYSPAHFVCYLTTSTIMSDFPEDIDENTPAFTAINMVKDEPNTGEPALDEITQVKEEEEEPEVRSPDYLTR
jgi:predicted Mrr-cat superfamily restriction endonuclease